MAGVAEDVLVPLPIAGIADIMRSHGLTEGMIIEALNQFGAGVSVYSDNNERDFRTK